MAERARRRRLDRATHAETREVEQPPHALAFDPDGNLYITEWLLGGRYTKLARVG